MKIASILGLVAAATLVSADIFTSSEPQLEKNIVPDAFIIQFQDGFDYAKSGIFLNVKIGLSFDIRQQFKLINAISIQVKSGHGSVDLSNMDGVKQVWPVTMFRVPKPVPANARSFHPDLTNAHNMTGVDYIREAFSYTGKDVKVGVVDSGIDYKHPAFGGCTGLGQGAGCRVIAGADLIGDDFDKTKVAKPDGDPMDQCNGHGTHVAGIIGADARKLNIETPFVGVAPGVFLGAYRVLSCEGYGPDDVILKGIEKAVDDGMQIINLSLGDLPSFRSDPLAAAAENAALKGVAVIGAAGNSGEEGVWSVEAAGLGAHTISVASFDNSAGYRYFFKYVGKEYPYMFSHAWGGSISYPNPVTLVPILKGDKSLSNGCTADSYANSDVKGKVVLIISDTNACTSEASGAVAKSAGAVGVLVQTATYGIEFIDGRHDIAMGSVERSIARALIAAYDSAATLEWSKVKQPFDIEGGGAVSDFSSWGLDGELRIKPDIGAPGGNIYSTYPQEMGSYSILSGTSMATPYIAGAHALLINANNNNPVRPEDARQKLMNTAIPGRLFEHMGLAPVAKQGSGLVNVKNAIGIKASFTPDRIELLDSVRFQGARVQVTIRNIGNVTTVYNLVHEPADAAISYRGGNTFPLATPIIENHAAMINPSVSQVTLEPGIAVDVTLEFREPSTGDASEFPFYSGFILATPKDGDAVPIRIPYAGVKGDISKLPILDTKSNPPFFKIFSTKVAQNITVDDGYKINWETDQPFIHVRLGSYTPELSVRLFEEGTRKFIGYLGTPAGTASFPTSRNRILDDDKKTAFTTIVWKGGNVFADRTDKTPVKVDPGRYQVIVAAQRKQTQGNFPVDFELQQVAVITF